MDGFVQDDRILTIDTPLGPNQFLIESFSGREAISGLFSFQASVRSVDEGFEPRQLIAQPVTVSLRLQDGEYRSFNGYVESLSAGAAAARGQRHYRLNIVPWLWFLTRTSDCRIFQNQSVPDILQSIFAELGYGDHDFSRVGKACKPRDYCVQYRETDLNFVLRLLQEEGLYFTFRHEAKRHVLVVGFQTSGYSTGTEPTLPFSTTSSDTNHVHEWQRRYAYQATAWARHDYNFETNRTSLLERTPTVSDYQQHPGHEYFDYPGLHDDKGDGSDATRLAMQAEEVERETVQAAGDCRSVAPGGRFTLSGHPVEAENGSYVVLSVSHQATGSSYETGAQGGQGYANSFSCMPSKTPYVPRRTVMRPAIAGLQTAVVVGPAGSEIHTNDHAQVKVQFHWDRRGASNEHSSCWIRVAQSWAGSSFGSQVIPRVGMEVAVGFLEGNPDRPMIVGLVPNAETKTHLSLPGQMTQTSLRTASSPGGGGYNEFTLEDKAGSEEVLLKAQKDFSTAVANNMFVQVGNASVQRAENLIVLQITTKDVKSLIQLTPDAIVLQSNGSTITLNEQGIDEDGAKIWLNSSSS